MSRRHDHERRDGPDVAEQLAVDREHAPRHRPMSMTNIRVRTTSARPKPASSSARSMIAKIARA